MSRREYLLQRYLNKVATTAELQELARIMAEEGHPYEDELFHALEADLQQKKDIPLADKIIADSLYFVRSDEEAHYEKNSKEVIPIDRPNKISWWSAAAAIFIAAGAVIYNNYRLKEDIHKEQIASREAATETFAFEGPQFITLPDNSTVLLNDGSELTYHESYGSKLREVTLTGEGFFDVNPDAKHKFVVRSGKVTTSVLGTAFNVRAFPGDPNVVVTVARGRVSVENDDEFLGTITPNEQIVLNTDNGKCVRASVNAAHETGWTNQFIIINNQRFEDAVAVIAARFNVKITLENQELNKCRITSAFLENPRLEEVLTVMSTLMNASYTLKNGSVTIHGGECQ